MLAFGHLDRQAPPEQVKNQAIMAQISGSGLGDASKFGSPGAVLWRAVSLIGFIIFFSVLWLLFASPANATPSISVTPNQGLNPDGDAVSVVGSGFEPDSQLFVMQCRSTSEDDHTCNSVGLQKVTTDGTGSFQSSGVKVTSRFGATDCFAVPCAVKTSAVSGHADNRDYDVFALISFNPAEASSEPVSPPTSEPEDLVEVDETTGSDLMAAADSNSSSGGGINPLLISFIALGLAGGVATGVVVSKHRSADRTS